MYFSASEHFEKCLQIFFPLPWLTTEGISASVDRIFFGFAALNSTVKIFYFINYQLSRKTHALSSTNSRLIILMYYYFLPRENNARACYIYNILITDAANIVCTGLPRIKQYCYKIACFLCV